MNRLLSSKKFLVAALVALVVIIVVVVFKFATSGSPQPKPTASKGNSASAKPSGGSSARSSGSAAAPSKGGTGQIAACDAQKLPPEVNQTVSLIRAGGPFPHPRNDGVPFRNAEKRLPQKESNYYREYTVKTPGASNRGARRIVTGGDPQTSPPDWYYTGDHYGSFCRLAAS